MFMQGKSFDEISTELGVDRGRVEAVVNSVLGQRSESDEEESFSGFDKEIMRLYEIQKKRVMRYISLEKTMKIPLPETKDNMIILLKILEVMWKMKKGGRVDLFDLRRSVFNVDEE